MLAALAAAGLPVLIHFLTRPRPRTILFPPYRFLVEAGSGRQAVHRLRTLLVLALRAVLVAALVIAFARPRPGATGSAASAGAARRAAAIVDASLSMRAVDSGVSLFARAQSAAADLLRGLEPGSSAAVILAGARPAPLLPALSRNLAALHEALSTAAPTLERGDPAAAVALAGRMLEGGGELFIFSDFQKTNWGSVDFSGLKGVSVILRPVADGPVDDVAIVGIEKSPQEPIEGETVEITCTLFNSTPAGRLEKVRLDLEGISRSIEVELGPYASGSGTFALSLPRAGPFPGRVEIGRDALAEDDVRYFSVEVRPALSVLVVADAGPEDGASAAAFLAAALAPSERAAPGIRVIRRRSADVDRGALETADLFFLVPPARPSGETVEVIGRRVRDGAPAVLFLDGPTSPPALAALAGALGGAFVPPFTLGRAVTPAEPRPLGQVETARGPFRLFRSADGGDLAGLLFARHFLAEEDPARRAEIVARHDDGSAAFSLSPAGRGTVVLANVPLAPDGGDLAGSPLFPAIVHELLRALRSTGALPDVAPGEALAIDCEAEAAGREGDPAPLAVTGPGGKTAEAAVVSRGRQVRLAVAAAADPGIYVAAREGRTAGIGIVNVHPKESDTRPIDPRIFLEAGMPREGTIAVLDASGDPARAARRAELWPRFLAAAALAAALEMAVLAFWRKRPGSMKTRSQSP